MAIEAISSSPPQNSQQSNVSNETNPQKLKSLLTREKQNLQQAADAQEKQKIQSRITKIEAQITKLQKSDQPSEADSTNAVAGKTADTAAVEQAKATSPTELDPRKPGHRVDKTV
ncbi:hypothetical protein [Roseibium sp. SCP14]|uniref:hypothetical protein n=1 Tax=Roseibium sp. SCP14 TaxID=3141375 RepID=UPI0033377251